MPRRTPAHRARRVATLVAVLVITLALGTSVVWASSRSASGKRVTSTSTPTGNRVLLVGDSLLWQSETQVTAALKLDGWDATIAASPGTTIEGWAAKMAKLVAKNDPDVIVVELGTNNCTVDECPRIARAIDKLMRHVPKTTPVHWLNVQNQPTYPAHPESVNNALAAATDRWSNITLVDMSAHFRNHPEWHQDDGLHFTTTGSEQLAALMMNAVGTAPR